MNSKPERLDEIRTTLTKKRRRLHEAQPGCARIYTADVGYLLERVEELERQKVELQATVREFQMATLEAYKDLTAELRGERPNDA